MADPILALLPESKAVYTLDKNLRPVVAELPDANDAATIRLAYVVIATLVSAGTTATATTLYKHGFTTGDSVIIDGATETEYNGTYTITVVSAFGFTYTFAGSGTTPATPGTIIAQFPTLSADEYAITICAAKDGDVWVLYDALAARGFDASLACILRKFDPETGELTADVVRPNNGVIGGSLLRIGELAAFKSLMDIGCGNLLTNDRDTHEVISVKVESIADGLTPVDPDDTTPDNTVGVVQKRYGLVIDPLDAAVNAAADRLFYFDANALKIWDLDEDALMRTVVPA